MLPSPIDYQLSLFQRILLIWLFIGCGLTISLQAAKHHVPEGPSAKWRLTAETKYVPPLLNTSSIFSAAT